MPAKVETTHVILPRELIVYQRSDSDVWQCRVKVDNKWFSKTTYEKDISEGMGHKGMSALIGMVAIKPSGA